MCSICGYINSNERIKNSNIINKMTESLSNNSYNFSNVYTNNYVALGYVKNNIAEHLTETQPLTYTYNSNEYVITYSGKLYNQKEIKETLEKQGFTFNTSSEAETILVAYIAYNEKCLEILNGVFAFAIYSKKDNSLFLARDRLGIKPLFYTIQNNTLIFGSEIKMILKHPKVKAVVGEKELMEIMALGPAHTPGYTFFKNIYEIKAGHFATYSGINFNTHCYWDLKTEKCEDDVYTAISKTKELVTNSLKRQIVSDIPVCSMLSGGLDSSVLTYLAKEELSTLSTFSIDFTGNDTSFISNSYQPTQDSTYVKLMSEFLDTKHTSIYFKNKELFANLKNSMIARDMPGMADIDSSMYVFCKAISDSGFKTCISGECSDEIFGGYPWYYKEKLVNYTSFPWALSDNIRSNLLKQDICTHYDVKEYIKESYNNTLKNVELNSNNEFENKFRKTNYLTIKWFMNTLIERTDRVSNATGLEVRVPFADYKLFEYVYNVPAKYKLGLVHNSEPVEKYLLRKAFENNLPKEIVYRKKSPFPKTYSNDYLMLVENEVKNIISDKERPLNQVINREYLNQILETKGANLKENWFGQLMTYPQTLAYLIQIDMWLEEYNLKLEV